MTTPTRVCPTVSRYPSTRLQAKRAYVEQHNAKYAGVGRDLTWRSISWLGKNPYIVGPKAADHPAYSYDDHLRAETMYLDRFESVGVVVRDSADGYTDRERTTGYYTDDYQIGVLHFAVVRVRTKHGRLYMAGTYHSDGEGVTLFPGNAQFSTKDEDDDQDVIRTVWGWARSLAEQSAESEREETAKDDARQKVIELRADRATLIAEFRRAKNALRKARSIAETDSDALQLVNLAREHVSDVLRERDRINAEIGNTIRANPYAF